MKIYTEINYEWQDGKLVEVSSKSFEYDGEVAECKGGGGHTTSTGTTYTANMPDWAKDPHKRVMSEAELMAFGQTWQPYYSVQHGTDQRIAGWEEPEIAARLARGNMFLGGDPYADKAMEMAAIARQTAGMPERIESGYQGTDFLHSGFGDTEGRNYDFSASRYGGVGPQQYDFGDSMYGRVGPRDYDYSESRYGDVGPKEYSFSQSPFATSGIFGPKEYDFGTFGGREAEKYMNPFWQNVSRQEEDAAREQFTRGRIGTEAQRVASGSRGGYRAALEDMLGRSEEAETIADIRGRSAQRAYDSAQQQYERDRAAAMGASRLGLESLAGAQSRFEAERQAQIMGARMGEESLAAAQQRAEADRQAAMQSGQMGEASLAAAQERAEADRRARIQSGQMTEASLTSAQARAEADRAAGMQSAQMTETSLMNAQQRFESDRQAYLKAAQMGDQSAMQVAKMNMDASRYNQDMLMKQAQEARDQAQMYTGLGDDAQARAYTRIGELERSGATEREMNQRWLDMAYEEEMNRRNFGRENLNWMQGIVSGAPGVLPASQYQKRPAPSFASQMAGFGLGASGLSQMFKS